MKEGAYRPKTIKKIIKSNLTINKRVIHSN